MSDLVTDWTAHGATAMEAIATMELGAPEDGTRRAPGNPALTASSQGSAPTRERSVT